MNSWDMLRSQEEREHRRRIELHAGWVVLVALVLIADFFAGVRYGSPREQPQNVVHALEDNADSLRLVRAQGDSIRHVDSSATAAVVAHRPTMAVASAAIRVSGDVRDSSVVLERPAAGADSLIVTPLVLPLPIATFIREAKIQLALDSTALATGAARIVVLTHQVNLLERRDSLHVEHEHALEGERDAAWRRGLKAGVKVGVTIGLVTIAVVKAIAK